MIRRIVQIVSLVFALSGCSYSYDVIAMSRDGHIVFVVDPKSRQQPDCVRRIAVFAENEREPVWRESTSYDDDCANTFPVSYGLRLKGRHQEDSIPEMKAKTLQTGIVYEVSTTTGATGYGGGRFVIHADGRIENLSFPTIEPTGTPDS